MRQFIGRREGERALSEWALGYEQGARLKMHNDKDYKLSTPNSPRLSNVRQGPAEIFTKSALQDKPLWR